MGLGISRVGVDSAGGIITGPGAPTVKINGATCSVHGDAVAGHGSGPHAAPTMIATSTTVKAEGKAVVRQGDLATCGHVATGSANVLAG